MNDPVLRDYATEAVGKELRRLRRTTGVTGALLASLDGRAIVSDVYETSPGAAAAITASSLGLAGRLGDLTDRDAALLELQARTTHGYVCVYAVGNDTLLAVLTDLSVNLALLKLDVRDAIVALESLQEGAPAGSAQWNDAGGPPM
jgi:predicted regulator of Ras-like GTPase activity (Roadblock/LC7/MglB family)